MSPAARQRAALLTIGLGTAVGPLDTSVNVAFPAITGGFGQPMAMIQWVVICYVLTYASLMLLFGRLGDMFGYRRIFAAGLVLSAVSMALCALAPSFAWLLVFRGLQGVGAGLVLSCGPALATAGVEENRRARVIGAYTMMFALASALGPIVGGVLVAQFGWPGVFWFRVPVALLALAALGFVARGAVRAQAARFDVVGAVLLAVSLAALLLALNMARPGGAGPAAAAGLALLAVGGFVAFVWQERRFPQPLLRLAPFRAPEFSLVNLASVSVYLVNFAVLLFVPYYLDRVSGMPAPLAGVVLATGYAGAIVAAGIGGRLAARLGSARIGYAGAWLVAAGTLLVGFWDAGTPLWLMLAELSVSGLGLGFFQVAYVDMVLGRLPREDRGVAGSLTMLTRTVGVVGGVTILTLAFDTFDRAGLAEGLSAHDSFVAAFQTCFLAAGGALAAFLVLSLLKPRTWFG